MRGRGDLLLDLRLLLRPQALTGTGAALAGVAALVGAYMPWYEVALEVSYQPWQDGAGEAVTQRTAAATLAGWEAHPWAWVIPALAVAIALVGVLAALDRPPPRHAEVLLGGGLALALVGAAGAAMVPEVDRFGGEHIADLADLAGRMPEDVGLGLTTGPASGLWVTLAAAALLVAIGLVSRHA